jgi:hypothetical protein
MANTSRGLTRLVRKRPGGDHLCWLDKKAREILQRTARTARRFQDHSTSCPTHQIVHEAILHNLGAVPDHGCTLGAITLNAKPIPSAFKLMPFQSNATILEPLKHPQVEMYDILRQTPVKIKIWADMVRTLKSISASLYIAAFHLDDHRPAFVSTESSVQEFTRLHHVLQSYSDSANAVYTGPTNVTASLLHVLKQPIHPFSKAYSVINRVHSEPHWWLSDESRSSETQGVMSSLHDKIVAQHYPILNIISISQDQRSATIEIDQQLQETPDAMSEEANKGARSPSLDEMLAFQEHWSEKVREPIFIANRSSPT